MLAQARATAELASANLRKAEVLSDQAALSLFTMPNEERLSNEACEYVSLRWQEEMAKLRKRVAQERQEEQEAVAEAGRLDRERAAELTHVQRRRISSSPRGRRQLPQPEPRPTPMQNSAPPSPKNIGGSENFISTLIQF